MLCQCTFEDLAKVGSNGIMRDLGHIACQCDIEKVQAAVELLNDWTKHIQVSSPVFADKEEVLREFCVKTLNPFFEEGLRHVFDGIKAEA